jgi:hypothetical protein
MNLEGYGSKRTYLGYYPEIYYYYYLTANGLSPGGSGTTIRQQTNNTHKHVQTKHSTQTLVERYTNISRTTHNINRKLT